MDTTTLGDDDMARRLPLPLAQLYRRAHNAITPASRLNTAYCLWEASVKLMGAVAVVAYADRADPPPEVADRLKNLARPALGHWWEFVRLLTPILAEAGDPGFVRIRDLLLGPARDDLPRSAGLDGALRAVLDGRPGGRSTVRLGELFDRLIRFRNREIGHGPLGQQSAEFHERIGKALLAGAVELLRVLDATAGRRLLYVADVRRDPAGDWLIERFELIGESSRRLKPLKVPVSEAAGLPHPGRVYLEPEADADGRRPPLQSLHPLVLCCHETAEVFFLNARRGLKRAEYLCYHPGRVEERPDLGVEQRALLAKLLGMPVDVGQVDAWAARSEAEEPPGPAMPAAPARRLGEFELVSELGRGGMGVVYRAWQPSLGRHVALKRLLNTGDAKAEARFTREIHALGRVDHPNLVQTYTSGSDGEYWFYAMELVDGATLAAVCESLQSSCPSASGIDLETWRSAVSGAREQARQAERPLGPADSGEVPRAAEPRPAWTGARPQTIRGYARHVAELVRQVAGAAHSLHQSGVVHRDIKPGNIMVTADGHQAVLMDLGLAQLADDVHGKLTRTRQFVGTLRYASPEQVLAVGGVDRRSDVYSLGATLWELLTLRPLFGATEDTPTPDLMQRIQYEEPESIRRYHPGVPRDLEAIVYKCLAKDPKRRYEEAADLADDLQRFLDDEPVLARREPAASRLWRRAWRRPVGTAMALVAIVASAALLFSIPLTYRAERINAITGQFVELMDRGDLDGADRRTIDGLIAKLEPLDAETAASWRQNLAERLARRVEDRIRYEPSVEPDVERDIRQAIDDLASLDPARAIKLGGDLAKRVRSWQVVARLSSPFDRVEAAFDPSLAVVEADGIGPRSPEGPAAAGGPPSSAFLPTRVPSLGNARLDVTLRAGTWDAGAWVGLLLHDNLWHAGTIRGLAYDRSGTTLVLVDDRGTTRTWAVPTRTPATVPPPPPGTISIAFGLPGGPGPVGAVAGTPEPRDTELGASIPSSRSVAIGPIVSAVSTGGRAVATAGPDGRIVLLALGDGSARSAREYRLEGREIVCLALDAGGRALAVGARDGTITLLGPGSERPRKVLAAHFGEVAALAFQPEGGLLASGGADTKVRLWEAAGTGDRPVRELSGHEGKVTALAFCPDGRTLASGGLDGKARLWNVTNGLSADPLEGHAPPTIAALAFSPGARTLAVAHGATVTTWDTRTRRRQPAEPLRPGHYALRLLARRPAAPAGSSAASGRPATLREAFAGGGTPLVQLIRDGRILREQEVAPPTLGGPLALSARIEGGRLELLLDGAQSVVFQDIFPLGHTARGSFGLELPAAARIEQLVASCQRPPERPSAMERGDAHYAAGDLANALGAYREQEQVGGEAEVGQEARCKQGVCLAELGQAGAAIPIFKALEAERGDRWPVVAACRLWLLYLQSRDLRAAAEVYDRLATQQRLERITDLVPADIPARIVDAYAPAGTSFSFLRPDPRLLKDLELALSIARGIRVPADQQFDIKSLLAFSYFVNDNLPRARDALGEMLEGPPLLPSVEAHVMENYGWILGRLGEDRVALELLDHRLAADREANHLLLIGRAQIQARHGRWDAAAADIDEYFRRRTDQDGPWFYNACLLRGFIREARGDGEGALASWRQGYRKASGSPDMGQLPVAVMASLTGELSDVDARIMCQTILGNLPALIAALNIARTLERGLPDIIAGLKAAWRSPRGRQYARRIALLDGSLFDCLQIQVPLNVAAICGAGAFGPSPGPDDEGLLWEMARNLFFDYQDGRLSVTQFGLLMSLWIGGPGNWSWAADGLRPRTRGPLAYVLGARYLQLERPDEARGYFRTALGEAGPDSPLRRRAQAALDRLDAPK